jgi:hypothetical protein
LAIYIVTAALLQSPDQISTSGLLTLLMNNDCEHICVLEIEPGKSSATDVEAMLLKHNVAFEKKETGISLSAFYRFQITSLSLLGNQVYAVVTIENNLVREIMVGSTQYCVRTLIDDLGTPAKWYLNDVAYELYYPKHRMIANIRRDELGRVASLRLLSESLFTDFVENMPLENWDESMIALFDECVP